MEAAMSRDSRAERQGGAAVLVENILLVERREEVLSRITQVLDRKGLRWSTADLPDSNIELTVDRWCAASPTVVLVDCFYGQDDEALLGKLAGLGLYDLREHLSEVEGLPLSLQIVRLLAAKRKSLPDLTIILIASDPPLSLIQEILRMGADWVWPQRTDFSQMPELLANIRWLSTTERDAQPSGGRVLIVENAKAEAASLRKLLEDDYRVEIIGENLAAKDFVNLDPRQAVDFFRKTMDETPYHAVIVDLALSKESEQTASLLFSDDSTTLQTITQMREKGDIGSIESILGGIYVIKHIRKLSPKLGICVLSNYLASSHTVAAIRLLCLVSRDDASVEFFPKTSQGHRALRDWLKRLGHT